jgi:hypothetical protein
MSPGCPFSPLHQKAKDNVRLPLPRATLHFGGTCSTPIGFGEREAALDSVRSAEAQTSDRLCTLRSTRRAQTPDHNVRSDSSKATLVRREAFGVTQYNCQYFSHYTRLPLAEQQIKARTRVTRVYLGTPTFQSPVRFEHDGQLSCTVQTQRKAILYGSNITDRYDTAAPSNLVPIDHTHTNDAYGTKLDLMTKGMAWAPPVVTTNVQSGQYLRGEIEAGIPLPKTKTSGRGSPCT